MRLTYFFVIILLTFTLCSCVKDDYAVFSGFAQGGTWTVKANLKGVSESRETIQKEIESLLIQVDTTFSGYNKRSILSRLNAGETVEKNTMFRDLEAIADKYRQSTEGALDVYSGPLFDIWGFGFKNDSLPAPERVEEAMRRSAERLTVNFNAIAQGYTCDLVAKYLVSIGVHDMLVDVGEIFCCGLNQKGKGWTIGIDTPEDGNNTPGASLSGIWTGDGRPCGVVTSGNYRKFYVRDGVKYPHTIDPRTGYPVNHNLLSATVIAPTATDADALATFFMVIGFEEARAYVLAHDELEACLITGEAQWRSPGF